MSDAKTLALPFAGFYESIHDDDLDTAISIAASGISENDGRDEDEVNYLIRDNVDWKSALPAYAQSYAETLRALIKQETGADLNFVFQELDRPQFYNYRTDEIIVSVDQATIDKLRVEVDYGKLKAAIEARHSSCSGFHSFYSNQIGDWLEKPVADWDQVELTTLFMAWINTRMDVSYDEIDDIVISYDPEMSSTVIDRYTNWSNVERDESEG